MTARQCGRRSSRAAGVVLGLVLAAGPVAPAHAVDLSSFFGGAARDSAAEAQRAEEIVAQLKELDQRLYAFADRYTTLIVSASDDIARDNPSAEQRRLAHQIKLVGTSSIYDIVTNPDPFTKLMDLLLVVTLQSYTWIDEDRAEAAFGDRAAPLVRALRTARTDVWKLAGGVLKPDQLQRLDTLILESRKDNPDVSFVSFMRFNEVSARRNQSLIAELKVESGFFSAVSEATKVADEARLLAERAFYQSKRMPFLINWQMEALLNETLAKPEIRAPLEGSTAMLQAAQRVAAVAEQLPQTLARERAALFDELDRHEPTVSRMLTQTRETVAEARRLSHSGEQLAQGVERVARELRQTSEGLTGTLSALDAFVARQAAKPGAAPAEPFRIEPYARMAADLNQAVAGVNQALVQSQQLLRGEPWRAAMADADAMARARIDQVFTRAVALVVLGFVLLLGYRFAAARIDRRSAPHSAQGSA